MKVFDIVQVLALGVIEATEPARRRKRTDEYKFATEAGVFGKHVLHAGQGCTPGGGRKDAALVDANGSRHLAKHMNAQAEGDDALLGVQVHRRANSDCIRSCIG
jgi:hypothetical protein